MLIPSKQKQQRRADGCAQAPEHAKLRRRGETEVTMGLSVLVSLPLLFQQNPRIKANGSSKSTDVATPTQSSIE
jgi:hypothetical protein